MRGSLFYNLQPRLIELTPQGLTKMNSFIYLNFFCKYRKVDGDSVEAKSFHFGYPNDKVYLIPSPIEKKPIFNSVSQKDLQLRVHHEVIICISASLLNPIRFKRG